MPQWHQWSSRRETQANHRLQCDQRSKCRKMCTESRGGVLRWRGEISFSGWPTPKNTDKGFWFLWWGGLKCASPHLPFFLTRNPTKWGYPTICCLVGRLPPTKTLPTTRGRQLIWLPGAHLCESAGVRLWPGTSNVSGWCVPPPSTTSKSAALHFIPTAPWYRKERGGFILNNLQLLLLMCSNCSVHQLIWSELKSEQTSCDLNTCHFAEDIFL